MVGKKIAGRWGSSDERSLADEKTENRFWEVGCRHQKAGWNGNQNGARAMEEFGMASS